MPFDFSRYFHNIAITLKEIAHADQTESNHSNHSNESTHIDSHRTIRKFHRVSGVTQLEELLQNLILTNDTGYQLVIEDNLDSRFFYNASTLLDSQFYVFYVLKRCKINDFADIEQAKEGCKSVLKKILSKMFRDYDADHIMQTANVNGLRAFQKNSITIQTIGPLADNYWGLICSFTLSDNPGIKFNPADWLP